MRSFKDQHYLEAREIQVRFKSISDGVTYQYCHTDPCKWQIHHPTRSYRQGQQGILLHFLRLLHTDGLLLHILIRIRPNIRQRKRVAVRLCFAE